MTDARRRKITTIWDNLRSIPAPDDPDRVRRSHRLRQYFADSGYDQHRLIETFNCHPAFVGDGIKLKPHDVPDDATVGELLVATIVAYDQRGWDVVT